MKIIGLIITALSGALLIYATVDFPGWADPASPASTHVSPHYIEKTMEETSVPNIVTAVLAEFLAQDLEETISYFVFKAVHSMNIKAYHFVMSRKILRDISLDWIFSKINMI